MPASNQFLKITNYFLDWSNLTKVVNQKWKKHPDKYQEFVSTWKNNVDWERVSKYKVNMHVF